MQELALCARMALAGKAETGLVVLSAYMYAYRTITATAVGRYAGD